ncbi:MAG: hypothetical protein ABI969_03545 [bacterium]
MSLLPRPGQPGDKPYRALPMYRKSVSTLRDQISMIANFVEVWLAKDKHDGVVGINLLTKVQMPILASLYGAMLAGVDYVISDWRSIATEAMSYPYSRAATISCRWAHSQKDACAIRRKT